MVKKGNSELHFNDPDLEGVIPHKSGSARTEGFYKVSKLRKRLIRRHEDSNNGRTIISTQVSYPLSNQLTKMEMQDLTAIRHMHLASKDERSANRRLLTLIGDSTLLRVNQLKVWH